MRPRIGLALLLSVVLTAVLGPLLLPDPQLIDIRIRYAAPLVDWAHPLGTDLLGRDTLARMSQALQIAFATGVLSILVALIVGALPGLLILARQPQFAPIIVKTISQIMVLFWVFVMSMSLYANIFKTTDVIEAIIQVAMNAAFIGAAIVLLVLRKKSSLLPEVPERTRWTGMGWRILRLLLVFPFLVPITLIVIELLYGTREYLAVTVIIGISIGLGIAPFTLRTTLAAGQPKHAIKAITLGLFSAMAWAMLAATYLGVLGLGHPPDLASFGRLIIDNPYDLTLPLITIITLIITIAGLVLTGDGIRYAYTKRHR